LQLTPKEAAMTDACLVNESEIVLIFDNHDDRRIAIG
jgi:hypothetical protein